ncbi:MAG: NAD(P)/FAD-dependent oxidoreductase [Candidatus Limnocylindrales bacterium]
MIRDAPDAIVVGSGPNGLAAAITLAQAGRSVVVYEGADTIGGGMRSADLTLPGIVHDVCSTIQGTSLASPFFRSLDLPGLGVELVHPEAPLAHPFDDGRVAMLERSVSGTATGLGVDARRYRRLIGPLVRDADKLMPFVLGPFDPFPRHPLAAARFAFPALRSAKGMAAGFDDDLAPALLTGLSAHSMVPLGQPATAAFGLVLAISAHAYGWPVVRGGTQVLADAMASHLRSFGGEILTGRPVTSIDELPPARATLFDTSPRAMARIAGDRLPDRYRHRLEGFRYGPGIFKLDWALDGPIPWRSEAVGRAGTVHLGGTYREVMAAEREVADGRHPERPFVLLVQATRFDRSRASEGRETGWAYCHVPNGSTIDMTERIEAQVERFAPGFGDRILARAVRTPVELEADNANYVGGDINGGIQDWRQLFTRPVARLDPYTTPAPGFYLCSSSTPPGGGVHGMCGVWAARSALRREFGLRV